MDQERENPFTPGAGEVPPHRAGHKDAERELLRRVGRVAGGRPGGMVVLYGPRGSGKTVLLEEIRERATSRGAGVRWLTPANWKNGLGEFVVGLPDGVVEEAETKLALGFDIGLLKARVERRMSLPNQTAEDILRGLAKSKSLVLLVDEAHRLPPDVGEVFLNAVQRCVTSRLPIMLVLAGTPGLRAKLGRADTSFWERSRRVRIGRLESQDDIRDALSLPAANSGLPLVPEALEFLVTESQGYPFFIQLVGEQSWEAAIARDPNADRIRLEDAQAGVLAANRQRDELYADREQEINGRNILSEARAVSKAFAKLGGDGVLPEAELQAELEPALTGDRTVNDAFQELFAVGLIWQTGDHAFWEPGIPSLCAYIAKRARGKTR